MSREGLVWEMEFLGGLQPLWTRDPDIEQIKATVHQSAASEDHESSKCKVEFLAEGSFNKLYKVCCGSKTYIMRIALPVCPRLKTLSEVATMKFVKQKTTIPVPTVLAFDANRNNAIGFEWILMEMMPGVTLRNCWKRLTMNAKETLVKRVADFQAQLSNQKLKNIGSLYERSSGSEHEFYVDQMISLVFFWDNNLDYEVSRGPFGSARPWLDALLKLADLRQRERSEKARARQHARATPVAVTRAEKNMTMSDEKQHPSQDGEAERHEDESESDEEDDEEIINESRIIELVAQRLRQMMEDMFSAEPIADNEPHVLFHDDLNMDNILVDEAGYITDILDWECVSAVPLWRAHHVPEFLDSKDCFEKPDPANTSEADEEDVSLEIAQGRDPAELRGLSPLYWTEVMKWELTYLRGLFQEEMGELDPSWVCQRKQDIEKGDLELAVRMICREDRDAYVVIWLNILHKGLNCGLKELIWN